MTPSLAPLHITVHHGYGDCDDCGMYEYGHFIATFADGSCLTGNQDGHLGGGTWAGDPGTALLWTLQKLGYEVRFDGVGVPPMPYRSRASGDWELEQLLPANFEVLNLVTEAVRDPEYPQYPFYTRVELPALSGEAPVVLTYAPPDEELNNAGWDNAAWEAVLRKLLEQRVELTLVATNED